MAQEIFDLSGHYMLLVRHGNLTCQIAYVSHNPFPPGSKGHFYYHQPPALPPLAGELRFRICDDASQFAYGRDLDIESGRPWNVPLTNIVMVGKYEGIRNLLLDEGFIDHELVADIENMKSVGKRARRKTGGGITLYDIDQPFSINLSSSYLYLRLSTRSCVRLAELRPFSVGKPGPGVYSPFSGKAIYFLSTVNQTELGYSRAD